MSPKLPPPDPFETLGMAPLQEVQLQSPTAVYVGGAPTAAAQRLASVILDARPGALIVVACGAARGQRQD